MSTAEGRAGPGRSLARTKGWTALSVARKDLATIWLSPIPWVVGAAFHVVLGLLYVDQLAQREQALIQPLFPIAGLLLLVMVPVLTMRSFAEEARTGTLDLLLAIPSRPAALVVGKWMACWITAVLVLAPSAVAVGLLERWGDPDLGPVAAGFFGLALFAAAAAAIGVLASSVTSSQAVAAVIASFTGLLLWLADLGSTTSLGAVILQVSLRERLRAFAGGALDSADTAVLLSMVVGCLVGAAAAIDIRRWR